MEELDREVLSDFDALWARVQPGYTPREPSAPAQASPQDDMQELRRMIDQTAAAAQAMKALAAKTPCYASRLCALACARFAMARQLQGAYYLLTGERHACGASCSVRHAPCECLRCVWQTSRTQRTWAQRAAECTDEPLLKTLYAELVDLLDEQSESLRCMLTDLLG